MSGKAGVTSQQLALKLGLKDKSQRYVIFDALDMLLEKGAITSGKKGRYHSPEGPPSVEGIIEFIGSGAAFVRIEGKGGDVYVNERDTGVALHGDRVHIKLLKRGGNRTEGKVLEVVERRRKTYVGTVRKAHGRLVMKPDDSRIKQLFYIPAALSARAQEGQKVVVELDAWKDPRDMPSARVTRILGQAGEHEVEINAIMAEFGLPMEFPQEVVQAARNIKDDRGETEYAQRRDMRGTTTFTIDPFDAKDLDDALSVRRLDNGEVEVGVHIADVTHYVRPGTPVDAEGLARATSVYLVDRVVPMLPERLSNDLCSLNADEDKLTFSAIFILDERARIKKEWFGRTVIRSRKRFAYEDAQAIIKGGEGPFKEEVLLLHGLAQVLRKDRFANGALEIGGKEMKFKLDEKGRPLEVYEKVTSDANWLIEEFMLLANKRVATWVGGLRKGGAHPFVYRIHDQPNEEKIEQLKVLCKSFGHNLSPRKGEDLSHAINRLLEGLKGKDEEDLFKQVVVRSMAKAVYSTENIGHYGLGFTHYTHFTSPIRRYPDMMVHRALAHYLDHGRPLNADDLEVRCKHSSEQERLAADAERASVKYKQAEYLNERVGQSFHGTISGITAWGVYVQLTENHCEGMIALRDMPGDHYRFEEEHYRLKGVRHGKEFRLGDEIRVTIHRVDMERRSVDLMPEGAEPAPAPRPRGGKPTKAARTTKGDNGGKGGRGRKRR